jgi:hypothetical protein
MTQCSFHRAGFGWAGVGRPAGWAVRFVPGRDTMSRVLPLAWRVSIAVRAPGACSSEKVCPMIGLIRPAATSARERRAYCSG